MIEEKGKKPEVPIAQKSNLTIPEASVLFNIGPKKLYELTGSDDCKFVLYVGNRRLIRRAAFEKYLDNAFSI